MRHTFFIRRKNKKMLASLRLGNWFVCFSPDSFRVISDDAVELHAKFEPRQYRASFEPPTPEERLFPEIECRRTRVLPKPTADYRAHNPQSKSCSFIRTDVRLLNEPVCTVSWFWSSVYKNVYFGFSCIAITVLTHHGPQLPVPLCTAGPHSPHRTH